MRLTCPNCGARYEVDDALIPPEGRDVQCSDCFTTWFQPGLRRPPPPPPPPPTVEAETEPPQRDPVPVDRGQAGSRSPEDQDRAPADDTVAAEPEAPGAFVEEGRHEPPPSERPVDETASETASDDPVSVPHPDAGARESASAASEGDPAAARADAETAIPPDTIHPGLETATRIVGENVHSEEDAPAGETAAPEGGGRRGIDPGVRDILRAEAEREARLRQAEAAPVETQAEMPLEEEPHDANRARRRADLEDAEDAFAVGAANATIAGGSRRDLLPDIEEINSTLRASEDRGGDASDGAARAEREAAAARRRGVRLGFFVTLAITAGLIWTYVNAPMLSESVPGVAPAVEGFAASVDDARFWLDDLARGLASGGSGS